eukprot:CAMPEP_0119359058 /NCGR_PEP_ID=MMETSP1334-20130426/7046_1 /TAXON_ID=127549 /ORGANISM="Calcidiscus leptoporus, Strain RCC1130" /LENGTH=366 /DNA_ID=CAMNT_0007373653 /DNA_START=96 /DNA_END=1196 /DNA_ORIENTATION=-
MAGMAAKHAEALAPSAGELSAGRRQEGEKKSAARVVAKTADKPSTNESASAWSGSFDVEVVDYDGSVGAGCSAEAKGSGESDEGSGYSVELDDVAALAPAGLRANGHLSGGGCSCCCGGAAAAAGAAAAPGRTSLFAAGGNSDGHEADLDTAEELTERDSDGCEEGTAGCSSDGGESVDAPSVATSRCSSIGSPKSYAHPQRYDEFDEFASMQALRNRLQCSTAEQVATEAESAFTRHPSAVWTPRAWGSSALVVAQSRSTSSLDGGGRSWQLPRWIRNLLSAFSGHHDLVARLRARVAELESEMHEERRRHAEIEEEISSAYNETFKQLAREVHADADPQADSEQAHIDAGHAQTTAQCEPTYVF